MPSFPAAFIALVVSLILWTGSVGAVQVVGLYEASVPVSSQAAGERERAIRTGFRQVVQRITGQVDAKFQEALVEVVSSASTAVQQYRYDVEREGPRAGQISLWMLFDAGNVERLLTERGISVWGDERPETLLWLAVDDGQRRLVSADSSGELRDAVGLASASNGIPLILPLMDLEDRAAIGFTEVWGDFRERILESSQRYGARSILIGRISRAGSGWQGRWTHILPDGDSQSSEYSPSAFKMADSGVSLVLRRLAERFASTGSAGGSFHSELVIQGAASLDDYARVTHYLTRMPLVVDWFMKRATGDQLVFDVQLKGGADAFNRAVGLDDVLISAVVSDPSATTLTYRLAQ